MGPSRTNQISRKLFRWVKCVSPSPAGTRTPLLPSWKVIRRRREGKALQRKKIPQRRYKRETEHVFLPSHSRLRISLTTTTTNLLSKNYQLPQMQAFLSNFGPLQTTTDKHFPKPPTHYLRRQASRAFSKARNPRPSSIVSRPAGLQQPQVVSQDSPGGETDKQEETPTSSPKRLTRPDGLWVPSSVWWGWKKRLLFLTVPLGDSYHGYESILGACQLPIENKEQTRPEPQSCRDA